MKRIAMIGAGQRGEKFLGALSEHRQDSELVAICDVSVAMLETKREDLKARGLEPRFYAADAFDRMVEEVKPDEVLVLTPDFTHEQYVCRAMELGCDVIVEKPLTTTYESCRNILAMQQKTGRQCRVTLNYRYQPRYQHLKELLMDGLIGNVVSVTWATGVPLHHGARFFRRWHGEKTYSGSLLVHKCVHLFDLVNFWLGTTPDRIFANGALNLFGPQMAPRLGLEDHSPRCGECRLTDRCPYYLDIETQETHNESPESVAARGKDIGYYRDQCVFRDAIDGYDTFSVVAHYPTGVQLDFSWMAGKQNEGLLFRGTLGSLSFSWEKPGVFVHRPYGGSEAIIEPRTAEGGHGGADPILYRDLFSASPLKDPYGARADLRDGVWSVLMGLAALESIETGQPVNLLERVQVDRPDFSPIPASDCPIDPHPLRQELLH